MSNLNFTQRLLHYFDFLLCDYGFTYAEEAELNSSFLRGGRFSGKQYDLVIKLGRRAPTDEEAHRLNRNSLAIYFVRRNEAAVGEERFIVHVHDLVEAMGLHLEPCPVVGDIGTRHMLDLALAYYADLLRSHFGDVLNGRQPILDLLRPILKVA